MSGSDQEHAWQRQAYGWFVVWAAVNVLLLTLLLITDDPAMHRPLAVGALVAVNLVYLTVGARAVLLDENAGGPGLLAAGLTIALVTVGTAASAEFAYILFVIYPHLFVWLAPIRRAAVAVVVCSVAVFFAQAANEGFSVGTVLVSALLGAVSMIFALAIGVWITRIIEQSAVRAEIIDELHSTREQLTEVHSEAGALKERQRLALEIHDTLAQGFTSLLMLAQAAEREIDTDRDAAREHLQLAQRTARANLAEARSMVAALTPPALSGASLSAALGATIDSFREETGLPAELVIEGEPRPLPGPVQVVLLRTVQEALTNVRRHAGATRADVRLCYLNGQGTVQVTDDGAGFDTGSAPGFGLRGMRSRVEEAGGAVDVQSELGGGTSVTVSLP